MVGVERQRALQRLFRIGVASLTHIERGEVGVESHIVRGQVRRFEQARLRAGEIADALLRERTLHPYRGRQFSAHGGGPLVHRRRVGVASGVIEQVGEIEQRVGLRLPGEDVAIARLGAFGVADRLQRETQVVEQPGVARSAR